MMEKAININNKKSLSWKIVWIYRDKQVNMWKRDLYIVTTRQNLLNKKDRENSACIIAPIGKILYIQKDKIKIKLVVE